MSMTIDEEEKIKAAVENRDYIVQLVNTVAKTMIEAFENLKIEDVNMFQLGYNKAIDEAICKVEEHKTKGYVTGITNNPFEFGACQMADDIVKILEQLKAGGENEY